jgi:hypothetical protein
MPLRFWLRLMSARGDETAMTSLDEITSLLQPASADELHMTDSVNHPSHYTHGKYEPIDVIEDWDLNFCLGNTVKYIARAGHKDPAREIEDLKKAAWYLARHIKTLEGNK